MDNELYDEYIRSVLGYSPVNNMDMDINKMQNSISNTELEKYYPEIYKVVYPMVKTKCNTERGNVTNEDIENMTDEIYNAIETRETTELNNNIENRIRTTQTPIRESKREPEIKRPEITKNEIQKKIDNREEIRETRQMNRGLRDLIKILLIREFINRPGPRPPMPPRPNYRPPFRPGQGVGNFPLNRDNMNYDYNIYEY